MGAARSGELRIRDTSKNEFLRPACRDHGRHRRARHRGCRRAAAGRRALPCALYRGAGGRALCARQERAGDALPRYRAHRRRKGRKALRRHHAALGLDPSRRRLCDASPRGREQGRRDGPDRNQSGELLSLLPRGRCCDEQSKERRAHCQCRRAARARAAHGRGHDRLHREQGRRRGFDRFPRRGSRERRHPRERGRALDHGHADQPQGDAEGKF